MGTAMMEEKAIVTGAEAAEFVPTEDQLVQAQIYRLEEP